MSFRLTFSDYLCLLSLIEGDTTREGVQLNAGSSEDYLSV